MPKAWKGKWFMDAAWWNTLAQYVGVFSAALAFLSSFVVVATGLKLSRETDRAISDARERAAVADEKAGSLAVEAERLKLEVAKAGSAAAMANEETARLTKEAAAQQERAAEAEKSLAAAQLELKRYVDGVAERQKPRHLTDPQRERLERIARAFPGTPVTIVCGSDEACRFARDVSEALRRGGMRVEGGDGNVMTTMVPFVGLQIVQRRPGEALPVTAALVEALSDFSPEPVFDTSESMPEGSVAIWIGVKP